MEHPTIFALALAQVRRKIENNLVNVPTDELVYEYINKMTNIEFLQLISSACEDL